MRLRHLVLIVRLDLIWRAKVLSNIVLGRHRHSNDKKFIEVLRHSSERVMYSWQSVDIFFWVAQNLYSPTRSVDLQSLPLC
jgi:hypothetical protein